MSTETTATSESTGAMTSPQQNFLPSLPHITNFSTKLNTSNFLLWKTQLIPMLKGYGLMGHVDGSISTPSHLLPNGTINPDFEVWERRDQLVLSWILSSIDVGFLHVPPPKLFCDNLGATYLTLNPVFHNRSKHLEVDFHFVRDRVARGILRVQYLCSTDQIADALTKGLSKQRFLWLRNKLTVIPHPVQLEGECKAGATRDK